MTQAQEDNQVMRTGYQAWDRATRWFHWINVVCVIGLASLGLAILNEKSFGVSSDGKVLLKSLHAYVGYVFAVNLGWRIEWAFIGGARARWRALLPFGSGYTSPRRQPEREKAGRRWSSVRRRGSDRAAASLSEPGYT